MIDSQTIVSFLVSPVKKQCNVPMISLDRSLKSEQNKRYQEKLMKIRQYPPPNLVSLSNSGPPNRMSMRPKRCSFLSLVGRHDEPMGIDSPNEQSNQLKPIHSTNDHVHDGAVISNS